MYACIPEIGSGHFEVVCALIDQDFNSSDPPPPCHSWIASCQSCLRLSRFLPLRAVNVYSLLSYLVPGDKLQGGELGHPPLTKGQAVQYCGYGLLRIYLLRTTVNKGKEKGRDARSRPFPTFTRR